MRVSIAKRRFISWEQRIRHQNCGRAIVPSRHETIKVMVCGQLGTDNMYKLRISTAIRSVLIVLLLAVMPKWAEAVTGFVGFGEYPENPSNALKSKFNPLGVLVACVDDLTWALLSCSYSYQLLGVDQLTDPQIQNQVTQPLSDFQIYGGHEHDQTTHPFYWVASSVLSPISVQGGSSEYFSPLVVAGNTTVFSCDSYFFCPRDRRLDLGGSRCWLAARVLLRWTMLDHH